MSRDSIIKKAYLCIDEVYPENNNYQDMDLFNVGEYLDQAARIIVKIVPIRALGPGVDLKKEDIDITIHDDGACEVTLPSTFERLISVQAHDWAYPLTMAFDGDSPKYQQQYNRVLRGTKHRPIAFLVNGGEKLVLYSTEKTTVANDAIKEFRGFMFESVDDNYPTRLHDITAWKTAELVLSAMNDVPAAQICQAKTQEILESL